MKPLAIDLFCGKGGWTIGLLDAGFRVIGFDLERWPEYPGELVIQDVLTLHGSQLRDATLIVASPPCQAYSYRAMPWKRAKALPSPDNTLFDACFWLQREASQVAGRHIPMVVENVCGAQKWVGRARWHYGSYYLWGDVPALMPEAKTARKGPGGSLCSNHGQTTGDAWQGLRKFPAHCGPRLWRDREVLRLNDGDGESLLKAHAFHLAGVDRDGIKQGGEWWHDPDSMTRRFSSRSSSRKAASAQIAMIPYQLARWVGGVFFPDIIEAS